MKVSDGVKRYLADDSIFYGLLILCVGITSFGLGRWSDTPEVTPKAEPAAIIMSTDDPDILQDTNIQHDSSNANVSASREGKFVGSVNSDKYHLPYCSGAQRIKEANKVWFASKEDAASQGYAPAGNCPGI